MGLLDHFKHDRGKDHNDNVSPNKQKEEYYQPPLGPPPGQQRQEQYRPPPGPPPQRQPDEQYRPPPGPPPKQKQEEQYRPPPGPPPVKKQQEQYQPPPGPPPGYLDGQSASNYPESKKVEEEANSYQQHNWQAIPDTSLLPPPPAFDHFVGATSNASPDLAKLAWEWTDRNPPFPPAQPPDNCIQDVRCGHLNLRAPEHAERGEVVSRAGALCRIKTTNRSVDHCYLSSLPLYFEHVDSPFRTEARKTIYYELKIESMKKLRNGDDSTVALGYAVAPYPTWRMPGWQRGSFAVHSDDGSRFMSHDGGGFDFTTPIRAGEVVGLGVCFSIPEVRPGHPERLGAQPLKGEVFFTRNGTPSGGWDIQEGLDNKKGWRADFLDGKWDLYAAIGTYGEVEISVNFGAQQWAFDPSKFSGLPNWIHGGRA